MNMILTLSVIVATIGLAAISGQLQADAPQDKNKTQQANLTASAAAGLQWLGLLDKERYDDSWKTGSELFQKTMREHEWTVFLQKVRKPLGKVKSRQMIDQRTAENPKGLPKGEYMVLFYNTSFDNKAQAYELVTLMQEQDGQWKILSYQVQ